MTDRIGDTTLYTGDALEVLREMPAESVHCVVTSPPYFGLRDYGIEPSVWDGETGCAHEWGEQSVETEVGRGNWAQGVNGRGEEQPGGVDAKREPIRSTARTAFCSLCGAWRGAHGLEPTPDCGRQFAELKPNVSSAQREYVHQRLLDVGLLDAWPNGMGDIMSGRFSRGSGVSETAPKVLNDELRDRPGISHNHDTSNDPGRGPSFGIECNGKSDNPLPSQENVRPSIRDDLGRSDGMVGDGLRNEAGQLQSPSDAQVLGVDHARNVRSSSPSLASTDDQGLSASRGEQQKSSAEPPVVPQDYREDSSRSSGKNQNRIGSRSQNNDSQIDHNFDRAIWAWAILPHDVRTYYRDHLCASCYVCHEVQIFREARRVLRADGTAWVNLGDSYAGSGRGPTGSNGIQSAEKRQGFIGGDPHGPRKNKTDAPEGFKAKDQMGMPWRVAFALQADGWYLRSACPWIKRNPMPESVTDRPASSIEYIFLLSKSARYFYDAEAVREAGKSGPSDIRKMEEGLERIGGKHKVLVDPLSAASSTTHIGQVRSVGTPGGRNRRNSDWFMESWQGLLTDEDGEPLAFVVNTCGFKGAHFATFPPRLVRPMILAGCPEHACPKCGAPWVREVEKIRSEPTRNMSETRAKQIGKDSTLIYPVRYEVTTRTIGEHPTCTCGLPATGGQSSIPSAAAELPGWSRWSTAARQSSSS